MEKFESAGFVVNDDRVGEGPKLGDSEAKLIRDCREKTDKSSRRIITKTSRTYIQTSFESTKHICNGCGDATLAAGKREWAWESE